MAIEMKCKPSNQPKEGKMKRKRFVLMGLLVVFVLPVAVYAQESDPATVINAANDAWNAGDADALKALYADDAIDEWIEGLVASNFAIEPESIQVEGDKVTIVAKAWADESRALGIAPLVTTDVYTVEAGLITSQTSTLTEESAAKLMAAMAAMEPETMPETGGEAFAGYGILVALGGLSVLGGLGLTLRRFSGAGQ
jgi:hypothetical protein